MTAVRTVGGAAALALASLLVSPATAAERWWTYIGGCGSADWLGLPSGTNAQGFNNCWAALNGGLSGQAVPTAADDVYLRTTGAGDLSVSFASAGRPAFTGRAAKLEIAGTGAGFAGLTLAATLPATTTLEVAELRVGSGGRGQLQQAGGRVAVSGLTWIGILAGDVGRYTLSGGTLQTTDAVLIGTFGSGEYTQTGGQATLDGLQLAGGGGGNALAQVSGGTLSSTYLAIGGGGPTATLAISGSGQVTAGDLVMANGGAASRGDITVTGAGARLLLNGASSQVGTNGSATLTVTDGGQVTSRSATLGALASGRGEARVAGSGALWALTGALTVGQAGTALLTVGNGGTVQTPSLQVGAGGRVLLDGGELASTTTGTGSGAFEWRSGTLRLGAAGGTTALGGLLLPAAAVLQPQQDLRVNGTLAVGSGLLALNGGTLQADALTLAGGTLTVVGSGRFDVGSVGTLSGQGTVLAAVSGGPASSIVATGGPLVLGQATRDDGFAFDGTLTAVSQQVVLLDRDGARLGQTTVLAGSGRLASANGLLLDTGRTLSFSGGASIEGAFTHRGAIAPLGGPGAPSLTFFDDVSGPGSFAGTIVFRGLYTPGGTAATVFGGGTLRVDTSGGLALDIAGLAPGSFARLSGIGTLDFGGALRLAFAPGLALPEAGATLDLLDFEGFSGSIDPARIAVSGLAAADAARLDFSQLAVDGTLRIAPVPEPAAAWLMLAGLGALASTARRRGRAAVARARATLPSGSPGP